MSRPLPDAALLPLMGPELLGEFIGDGNSINVATLEIFPPYRFPLHIDREGRGHYGGASVQVVRRQSAGQTAEALIDGGFFK